MLIVRYFPRNCIHVLHMPKPFSIRKIWSQCPCFDWTTVETPQLHIQLTKLLIKTFDFDFNKNVMKEMFKSHKNPCLSSFTKYNKVWKQKFKVNWSTNMEYQFKSHWFCHFHSHSCEVSARKSGRNYIWIQIAQQRLKWCLLQRF